MNVLENLFVLLVCSCFASISVDGCWCTKAGRFCGDQLDQCLPNIVYQCERDRVEPRQVAKCDTGCTMSSGIASCWQKATATITVN